jgi:hypothetical protein
LFIIQAGGGFTPELADLKRYEINNILRQNACCINQRDDAEIKLKTSKSIT